MDIIDDHLLDKISQIDSFKMFKKDLKNMSKCFGIKTFKDCEEVTTPGSKETIYLLIKGAINVISDERIYKNSVREIKKL